MSIFGGAYAGAYDALYQDKNYKAECDIIEELFERYGEGKIHTILDVGCGTGGHSIELASRGYDVWGIDISEDMLREARKKAAGMPDYARPKFIRMDARKMAITEKFDAVIMMFAVLGYQTSNEDVIKTLDSAREEIRDGGLLIADVWYGPAVLTQKPSERIKSTKSGEIEYIRASKGTLDTENDICSVEFKVWELEDNALVSYTEEKHDMRYFFIPELNAFLNSSDFGSLGYWEFTIDHAAGSWGPDDSTWNIIFAAKAV